MSTLRQDAGKHEIYWRPTESDDYFLSTSSRKGPDIYLVFLADWQQFLLEPFWHCGRCCPSTAIYFQERGNNKKKLAAIWITFVLTLSACVPIPQQAPLDPRPETKAGLSDLASVFAKWDTQDDTTEYMELLTEFEKCIHDIAEDYAEDYGSRTYTDSEMTAHVIYTIAVLMTAASMERIEKVESGELDPSDEDFLKNSDRPSFQYLTWAIEFCEGD